MLLAISDICADGGEAFTGKSAGRKFVWRHKRRFLSPQNTAALYAPDRRLEPNFSFSFDAAAAHFLAGRRDISFHATFDARPPCQFVNFT
jgi:hypothetical protein